MSNNSATLNRVCFDNRCMFTVGNDEKLQLYLSTMNNKPVLVRNRDKSYYCTVTEVSWIGFTAVRRYFDVLVKKQILFTECQILPDKDPLTEASGVVAE